MKARTKNSQVKLTKKFNGRFRESEKERESLAVVDERRGGSTLAPVEANQQDSSPRRETMSFRGLKRVSHKSNPNILVLLCARCF